MNSLIERANKVATGYKALLNRTSNLISNLETKLADLENVIEETIGGKVEKAMDILFENDENS